MYFQTIVKAYFMPKKKYWRS